METIKRTLIAVAAAALLAAISLVAFADPVTPATATINSIRGEAVANISGTFYQDATLRFTNCVIYSGTSTNSAVQNLHGVTVTVSAGNASTNVDYTATVLSTNAGTWSCDITVPSFITAPYIQVKVTDANTNSYIYPWKALATKTGM